MNKLNFLNKIEEAYKQKQISPFVYKTILSKSHSTSDEKMLDEIYSHALSLGSVVNSEEDLQRFVGAENFIPYFAKKIGVQLLPEDIKAIYHRIISKKINNIEDIGKEVFEYINDKRRKVAYPTIRHWGEPILKVQNIKEWIGRLNNIYKEMGAGGKKSELIKKYTQDMSSYEKNMFEGWMKYYEDGEHTKYAGKEMMKIATDEQYIQMINDAFNARQQHERKSGEQKQKRQEAQGRKRMLKRKMMSRLRSMLKLLHDYSLDDQDVDDMSVENVSKTKDAVDALSESITNLNKNIGNLTASSTVDKIYKTANVFENKFGENLVSGELIKIAQEFEGAAEQIDQEAVGPSDKLVGAEDISPNLTKMEKEFDSKESLESLKRGASPEKILEKLEKLSKFLKDRTMTRELSEIDVMLGEIEMSVYFQEISECTAKLLEAHNYSANKIEEAIAKLRGGIEAQQKALQPIKKEPKIPEEAEMPTARKVKVVPGEPPRKK